MAKEEKKYYVYMFRQKRRTIGNGRIWVVKEFNANADMDEIEIKFPNSFMDGKEKEFGDLIFELYQQISLFIK